MVDIGAKPVSERVARAEARIRMQPATLAMIAAGTHAKGDVFACARIAGIQAAKRTADAIPLCHPLPLGHVEVELLPRRDGYEIEARVRTLGPTGAEMEALHAVAVAALTVYDMVKAADRRMTIGSVRLIRKSGGASGSYRR